MGNEGNYHRYVCMPYLLPAVPFWETPQEINLHPYPELPLLSHYSACPPWLHPLIFSVVLHFSFSLAMDTLDRILFSIISIIPIPLCTKHLSLASLSLSPTCFHFLSASLTLRCMMSMDVCTCARIPGGVNTFSHVPSLGLHNQNEEWHLTDGAEVFRGWALGCSTVTLICFFCGRSLWVELPCI